LTRHFLKFCNIISKIRLSKHSEKLFDKIQIQQQTFKVSKCISVEAGILNATLLPSKVFRWLNGSTLTPRLIFKHEMILVKNISFQWGNDIQTFTIKAREVQITENKNRLRHGRNISLLLLLHPSRHNALIIPPIEALAIPRINSLDIRIFSDNWNLSPSETVSLFSFTLEYRFTFQIWFKQNTNMGMERKITPNMQINNTEISSKIACYITSSLLNSFQ
jgi:hypothetical protein